jgi:hypothetical protein
VSHILGRFHRRQQAVEDQRKIGRIILEVGGEAPPATTSTVTLPGDKRRLRGIPVAGGACGTSPETDPVAVLLAKERRSTS